MSENDKTKPARVPEVPQVREPSREWRNDRSKVMEYQIDIRKSLIIEVSSDAPKRPPIDADRGGQVDEE